MLSFKRDSRAHSSKVIPKVSPPQRRADGTKDLFGMSRRKREKPGKICFTNRAYVADLCIRKITSDIQFLYLEIPYDGKPRAL